MWSGLLARSPADAPWREDLEVRLAQLRQALGPRLPLESSGETPIDVPAGGAAN